MLTEVLVALVVALAMTGLTLPVARKVSLRYGLVGHDVHKADRPLIPKLGGLAIVVGTMTAILSSTLLGFDGRVAAAFGGSTLISAAIGLFEDVREVNPILKPLVAGLAGFPIILLGVYHPSPVLPFIGRTRLTIIYPILILIAFSVLANAVNSTDVLNGSMAFSSIVALSPLLAVSLAKGELEAAVICVALLGSLAAFATQNRYPARIFAGNMGSLFVGGSIAAATIIGSMEVLAIVALMPQIMNEFHIIFSAGGLKNAKLLRERPVEVKDGLLMANMKRDAPVTLVRLITSVKPMSEPQVVKHIVLLSVYSALLALLTELVFLR